MPRLLLHESHLQVRALHLLLYSRLLTTSMSIIRVATNSVLRKFLMGFRGATLGRFPTTLLLNEPPNLLLLLFPVKVAISVVILFLIVFVRHVFVLGGHFFNIKVVGVIATSILNIIRLQISKDATPYTREIYLYLHLRIAISFNRYLFSTIRTYTALVPLSIIHSPAQRCV